MESETEEELRIRTERKVKKAAQLLFFRRHRIPGVKGWELKKGLGEDYVEVIAVLNSVLDKLGMEVKRISDAGGEKEEGEGEKKAERDRFMIVLKSPVIEKASGERIDNVAMLSATLAYIISKQGKAQRKAVEDFLSGKFPKQRIYFALDRYIKQGYVGEDDKALYIGWRTRAEVDRKSLLDLILS
ncbi:MAG TPA: hypothetical protein VMW40_00790 [Candidatus Bathyarchaeia archaeon]|nr:hypothetical protein [Candidatus Bathyarchaeia archaeon]